MARAQLIPVRALLPLLLLLLIAGCGKTIGEECEITGSGFHARDPCRGKCLSRWTTVCPGGREAHLGLCAGEPGCAPGDCPTGQVCYAFEDPFEERSFCLPADACGDGFSADELSRWERASAERARATRERYAEKERHRSGEVTAPAEPPPPKPGP